MRPTRGADALGCPTFGATFEDPEHDVTEVALGEPAWIRGSRRRPDGRALAA